MRKLWFYILIFFIWVGIFLMGMGIYRRLEEKTVVASSYYDWNALLDEDARCVDTREIDMVLSYDVISEFMEMISDGMFDEVKIDKEDKVHISLKMYMKGRYYDKLVESFPEMGMLFGMIQGLDMEIVCLPTYDNEVQLHLTSAKVGMIELPVSLFSVLEDEINDVFDDVMPMDVEEYAWQEDGLYISGVFPLRIERNSVAVFLVFVLLA